MAAEKERIPLRQRGADLAVLLLDGEAPSNRGGVATPQEWPFLD